MALTDSLGIGIDTPHNKVDILGGGVRSGTHPKGLAFYVTANSLPESQGVEFRHDNGTQGIGLGYNTIYASGSLASQNLGLKAKGPDGDLFFSTNGIQRVLIRSNGNVGIGFNTPQATLSVSRGTGPDGTARFDGTTFTSTFYLSTSEHTYIRGGKTGSHVILNDAIGLGNVGIGTGNPLQKLHIEGKAYVKDSIGIGTSTPHAQLQLSNATGNRKIVMWEMANNPHQFFGFGVEASGMMRYQVPVSSNDHIFYSGASSSTSNELMRITGTGNVGIGVSSPLQKFHLVGNAYVNGIVGIGISSPQATLDVARGIALLGTARFQGTTFHSHFNYATTEDTYIRGGKTGSHVIINDQSGLGNVGIGLIGLVPGNKLDVASGSARSGSHPTNRPLYVTGDLNDESNGIEFRHNNGTQGIGFGFNTIYATGSDASQNLTIAAKGASGVMTIKTNGQERFRINGGGNVMIGTNTPATGHLLSVAGKIAAQEILVDLQADWPDYVFEETYPLKSFDELKNFIEENNHLPGVPSAKEVDQNGVYLGEINKILLEKIEELTLYLLQQEERIQQLEKSINSK